MDDCQKPDCEGTIQVSGRTRQAEGGDPGEKTYGACSRCETQYVRVGSQAWQPVERRE